MDEARASLVVQEYRFSEAKDATVRVRYPGAREITIETNLDEASAAAMANAIFAQTKVFAKEFEVEVEAVYNLADFLVSPPRCTVAFSRHPALSGTTYTVVYANINRGTKRTLLRLRG